jgi:hypothetical protein
VKRATRTDLDVPAMEAMHQYREAGQTLEQLSRDFYTVGKPLHARHRAQKAFIAFRAERAEMLDPEPPPGRDCACVDCRLYRMGLK